MSRCCDQSRSGAQWCRRTRRDASESADAFHTVAPWPDRGPSAWRVGAAAQGLASLKLKAGEGPFERLGGVIALDHESVGALAQLRDGRMTGVSQDAARVDGEQQLDLIDPA